MKERKRESKERKRERERGGGDSTTESAESLRSGDFENPSLFKNCVSNPQKLDFHKKKRQMLQPLIAVFILIAAVEANKEIDI